MSCGCKRTDQHMTGPSQPHLKLSSLIEKSTCTPNVGFNAAEETELIHVKDISSRVQGNSQ